MGETYLQSREELIDLVQQTGYRRVLVRIDGPGFGTDAFRIHDHISYLAMRLPGDLKLAVLYNPTDGDTNSWNFAEVVGENRGLNLKVFEDEDRADAWLMQTSPQKREEPADP